MIAIDVLGLGLACPLGLRALEVAASLRANLRSVYRLADADALEAKFGDSIRASRSLALGPALGRAQRAGAYAQQALHEALKPLGPAARGAPLYLATPAPDDAAGFEVGGLFGELGGLLGSVSFYPSGRAGLFAALAEARLALERGAHPFAIVGGADSLADPASLRRLAEAGRLLGDANADGLIPGEGAAFLVLTRASMVPPEQLPLARLAGLALAQEPAPRPGQASEAAGLTAAFAELCRVDPRPIELVHSAQPPQRHWARELAFALTRQRARLPEPLVVRRCGDALGELGAAAGAVALALAIVDLHPLIPGRPDQPAPPDRALVYARADAGQVGAARIHALRSRFDV